MWVQSKHNKALTVSIIHGMFSFTPWSVDRSPIVNIPQVYKLQKIKVELETYISAFAQDFGYYCLALTYRYFLTNHTIIYHFASIANMSTTIINTEIPAAFVITRTQYIWGRFQYKASMSLWHGPYPPTTVKCRYKVVQFITILQMTMW